jgi:glyoxylase-like metal-dependent hydrolase (beta-lactamase superfamily II)
MMKTLNAFVVTMFVVVFVIGWVTPPLAAQQAEWCKKLPRPAYSKLERVPTADTWFEVYRVRPGVFAIYEPHQLEEVISYLIIGADRALLFDTGMGIGNIQAVVAGLTRLPVSVVNSHTHNDHVGDNWRFKDVYGMDTDFTRANARGSKQDAQAELAPEEICGALPAGFDRNAYATKPFHVTHWLHDGDKIHLGGRALKVIGTIYLYRPETDLDAYVASIEKLAALAPHLQLLLPSHNVPVADPSDLPKVVAAIQQVRRGELEPVATDGKREYLFDGFSFLMRESKIR